MVEREGLPQVTSLLCTRCGACVAICPPSALEMTPQGPEVAAPERCEGCGLCEEACPVDAIVCEFAIVW